LHPTEFAGFVVVGSVIGVIDEIEEDGPRPRSVEDLHRLYSEEFVGSVFEVVLIDRMKPVSDSIAAGCIVRLGTDLPDGRLSNGSPDDDGPNIAGIEGRALDPWQGEVVNLALG
jgi:hypothetical protein